MAALPSPGQSTLTAEKPINIIDATLDVTQPPPQPSIPSKADPYPSSITVSNKINGVSVQGKIQRVAVVLPGLTHSYLADVDVLLTGPNNKKALLMSDVAVGMSAAGGDYEIDPAATGGFPDGGAPGAVLPPGKYRPTDFGPDETFPDVAGPYSTDMSVFNGDDGKGDWSLYVLDDRRLDSGSSQPWKLKLWFSPVITVTNDTVTLTEDTTTNIPVTVLDTDTALADLKLEATSSDETIVTNKGGFTIIAPSSGNEFRLGITPLPDKSGTITVTLKASDKLSSETKQITVVILPANDAPTIGDVTSANTTNIIRTAQGQLSIEQSVKIADIDSDITKVVMSAESSDTNIVLSSDVFFDGSTGTTRKFYVAPKGAATGNTTIKIYATDDSGAKSLAKTVPIEVFPVNNRRVAANFTPITIADGPNGTNTTTVTVADLKALIGNVTVTLANVTHPNPEDLDVWVTGPKGQKVILMSAAGGGNSIRGTRLTFDSTVGFTTIPDNGQINTGTYNPADWRGATPQTLASFADTDPNGTWTITVVDRVAGNTGSIAGGVILDIYAKPVFGTIDNLTVDEDSAAATINFSVTDVDGLVTNVVSTLTDPTLADIETKFTANATTGSIKITPKSNKFGTTTVNVTAYDNAGFSTLKTFTLKINSINDLPTISPINKQITYVGKPPAPITFTVGDVETAVGSLIVSARSSNTKLLPEGNIAIEGNTETRTLKMFPVGLDSGTVDVTLTVKDSDGGEKSTTFRLDVLGAASPLFANQNVIILQDAIVGGGATNAVGAPSQITVKDLVGSIVKVQVNLVGLKATHPEDLDVMLVGPQGQKVLLMSDVGGAGQVSNVQLVFSDDAAGTISAGGPLASGIYKPSDENGGDSDVFTTGPTAPAPNNALSVFAGGNPNGTWSLWVADDTGSGAIKGDEITGGWLLSIQTVPVLSPITGPITTTEDKPADFNIDIGDSQAGIPTTFTVLSDNLSLIKPSGVTFSDGGDIRKVTVTPEKNANGTAELTISATVGGVTSNTQKVTIKVTAVNDDPQIADLPGDRSIPAGVVLGPVNFTVSDVESDASTLKVEATSSNPLLPNSNLILGGSGANRTITILPAAGVEVLGSVITLTVTDPDGGKSSKAMNYSATRSLAFTNPERIDIRDNSAGRPYPSTINVKGVGGQISKVRVTLRGLSHSFPDDIHALLVSPDDKKSVILMGNAGGGAPTNSVPQGSNPPLIIGFDDGAATKIPDEALLTSGAVKPGNYGSPDLPSPAPKGPYNDTLATFNGISANGDWKLYVFDDTATDDGVIADGWTLVIETAPTILEVATQRGVEDTVWPVEITLSDADTEPQNLTLTAESIEKNVTTNLVFDPSTTNKSVRVLRITPIQDVSGAITNTIHLVVSDGSTSTSRDFLFSVEPVNDSPTITTSTNKVVINEDTSKDIVFEISDVDSTLDVTNIVIVSQNQTILPDKNITKTGPTGLAQGNKGLVTVTVSPAANQNGDAPITVSITDKNTTSSTNVLIVVTPVNDTPTISDIPNYTGDKGVQAGGTIKDIVFTVTDVETEAKNLTVTAKARKKGTDTPATSIPDANLFLSQSGTNRILSITTIGTDAELVTVTVTVSDGDKSASDSFDVEVKLAQPVPGTVFANTNPIEIKDNAAADASTINVSGLRGKVYKLAVTVDGFSHTAPDDVDILLKGPNGKAIKLMSDAGGRIAANNLRLTFSDTGASGLLRDDGPLASGDFVPSDYEGGADSFPGANPSSIEKTLNDAFGGSNPNGNWTLYVVDDTANDKGSIAQGWSIKIVTTPTIEFDTLGGGVNYLDYAEDTQKSTRIILADYDLPGGTSDGYDIQKRSSNENVIRGDKVEITKTVSFDPNSPVSLTAKMVPEDNAYDESTNLIVTLTLVRKSDSASASLVVTNVIRAVNDRPTLTRTTDRSTTEGVPIEFALVISDPPEPSNNNPIHLVAETLPGGESVISSTNILLNGISNKVDVTVGKEVIVRLVPNAVSVSSPQTATIRIVATDSSSTAPATQSSTPTPGFGIFNFTVLPKNDAPSIDKVDDLNVTAGKTATFTIKVNDPDDNADIKVTAKSRDETLIASSDIVVTPEKGGTGNRTVTAKAQLAVTGRTVIDLTVEDPKGAKATQTVNISVTPSRERRYEGKLIKINDLAVGDPYPAIIGVDDLVGNVAKVRVELIGFSHGYPDDVDMVLVSPKGTKVMLMSDAGGSTAVTNLNLVFNNPTAGDPAADPISDLGPLTSGTFRPANWDITNDPFTGGPSAPFETDLGKFAGEPAKGDWKLYVVDDTRQDAGEIKGWALYITTQPRIDGLPTSTVALNEDDPIQVPFTIIDESFAPLNFKFAFASTNGAVVNPANLTATQVKNENFQLTGRPVTNAFGASEITILATNDFNQVVSGKFSVSFASVNDAPFVTKVSDVTIFSGEATTPVAFDYGDAETPKKDLKLEISSSNTALVPTNNVLQIGNTLVIAPVGTEVGESDITIRVTDAQGLQDKTTFKVSVVKALQAQFANTDAITIRDNNTAQPYPSTIEVNGLKGKVSKVTVTLAQITHPYPADIDALLVSPNGTNKVVLISDAGGGRKLDNARLTFDDGDTNTPAVPYNPPAAVASGTYKPSNYEGTGDTFPAPAPSGAYTYELKSFQGIDPNGTWSLYIVDDVSPDSGTIAGGWILNIFTTEPVIGTIADQTTDETVPVTVAFQVSDADTALDKLVATASTDRPSLLSVGAVQGTGKDRTVTVTPVGFQNGSATVTIELSDGTSTVSSTFNVTVRPVNQPPTITGLTDKSTPSNRTLTVPFVVADNETASSNIVVGASIERPSFGSVEVSEGGANRVLTFRPSGEQGATRVSVIASDGELTSTNSIEISVGSPYSLTISPIADQNVTENGSKIVPFVVSGSDTGNVEVKATIGDSSIVSRVELVGSGSAWSASVFVVPGANGSTKVDLVATDEFGTGTGSFTVNIIPLDDPPVIGAIADVTTYKNINAIVRTVISDPDTPLTALTFTWGSSNPTLVKTVLFSLIDDGTLIATIIPNRDQVGEASVTLFAADATTKIGRPLLLKVIEVPNNPPVLSKVKDQSTLANQRLIVDVPVTDPDTAIADLVFTATVSNPSVLKPIAFSNDGTTVKALISPVTDATGLSAVTITVNDGKNTVSTSFAVGVTPAAAPVLTSTIAGGTITITWANGGELEESTSSVGPWVGTGNTSGSFTEPVVGNAKFYRVRRSN